MLIAQTEAHDYRDAWDTVQWVHALEHKGMANVHYLGAGAALAVDELERELKLPSTRGPSQSAYCKCPL